MRLLHPSFRPRLATTPLRFAMTSPPSGRQKDLHPQAVEKARYTKKGAQGAPPPTVAETDRILSLLEDSAAGPVFVHCKRGADRTGAVIAAYRIDHDKWDNQRALKEALASGMRCLQFERKTFIRTFEPRTRNANGGAPTGDMAGTTISAASVKD